MQRFLRIGVPVRREFKFLWMLRLILTPMGQVLVASALISLRLAAKTLPYALRYEYIPYDLANSYDQLIMQVFKKKLMLQWVT
ncbi:hypothetical protein EJB05_53892 [Eragrostis curvula]|uniref:Uncharacterized protein n=1 Tax=Eragrostis curvula TaxID=38414 RepID=A0A5J9SNV8_9POAL|nr:hypothetical protein EJB05_53892 [Eragrostis curvula]